MPNSLPLNWCECKFGDVGYLQNGYAFNSKLYKEKGVNLIRISDIQDNEVVLDNCVKVSEKVDECFQAHKGDFLLAMSGATTGKTGIYNSEDEALLNQRVGNLKIYDEKVLLPKFRNYFISNKRSLIEKLAYGGAQPNISKAMIEDLDILLPPLAEQERIVEKIEALFASIDEGVERLKSAQAQIKQYRQSVLKSAFEGKLYKTTGWKEVQLKDVCRFRQGVQVDIKKQLDYSKKGYDQFLRIINYTQPNNSSFKYVVNDLSHYVKSDDIVMVRYGASAGFVGRGLQGVLANNLFSILFNTREIFSDYIYYFLKAQYSKLNSSVQGGAMPAISFGIIGCLIFPLPTLPEQQRIVAEIEKRFAVADELEKAVNEGLEKADKLKQSILKKAFEGKLVPQDPNDEPASVLLERIKKEQKPTKGKKK